MSRAWVCAFAAAAGLLQAGEPPSAEAVLDRALEAAGGRAAHEKIRTAVLRYAVDAVGKTGIVTIHKQLMAPDLYYARVESGGECRMESGFDGKEGWALSPGRDARGILPSERQGMLCEGLSGYDWKACFKEATYLRSEEADLRECHVVRLDPKDAKGVPVLRWYEASTGLLLQEEHQEDPDAQVHILTSYFDYRKVEGIRIPYKVVQDLAGQKVVRRLEEARLNVDVDPARFRKP